VSIISRAINPGTGGRIISLIPLALGAHWGECIPSCDVDDSIPRAASARHDKLGLHSRVQRSEKPGWRWSLTPTQRTEEQTFIGTFWLMMAAEPVRASETLQSDHGAIADQRR